MCCVLVKFSRVGVHTLTS
ncbi:hypothetical protein LINGRAHAP2_LOCUS24495 [Linum grandiflorum]